MIESVSHAPLSRARARALLSRSFSQWLAFGLRRAVAGAGPARARELARALALEEERADGAAAGAREADAADAAAADAVGALAREALRLVDELLYLAKLKLVKLAVLAVEPAAARARGGAAAAAAAASPQDVLSAWKLLNGSEPKARAAALELLEALMTPAVRRCALALLDGTADRLAAVDGDGGAGAGASAGAAGGESALLRLGAALFDELDARHLGHGARVVGASAAPAWLRAWLAAACGGDRLGREPVSYTHLTLPTKRIV